jgi:hypothetical protein
MNPFWPKFTAMKLSDSLISQPGALNIQHDVNELYIPGTGIVATSK